ncbi:FkbM family methyltransferase [Aurantiacibacter aquimixticola]|uniref:Methyltransferase FkbM domain-containing protein n=1 Tax=Aurantiacibacter aquimixticola TaxID=1958945 RepID=A0A419RRA7_9SPHN|nr:FkbM family methyltransferase [Aurantiacibacter aquimixticola]RJY08333.1 hypothetical protein D6201_02240 [Aurantiacibacter aquimixticola]
MSPQTQALFAQHRPRYRMRGVAISDGEDVSGPIHYCNIDVEGSEMRVLRGLDFDRHRPMVISAEIYADNLRGATRSAVHESLETQGYACVASTVITFFFVDRQALKRG